MILSLKVAVNILYYFFVCVQRVFKCLHMYFHLVAFTEQTWILKDNVTSTSFNFDFVASLCTMMSLFWFYFWFNRTAYHWFKGHVPFQFHPLLCTVLSKFAHVGLYKHETSNSLRLTHIYPKFHSRLLSRVPQIPPFYLHVSQISVPVMDTCLHFCLWLWTRVPQIPPFCIHVVTKFHPREFF